MSICLPHTRVTPSGRQGNVYENIRQEIDAIGTVTNEKINTNVVLTTFLIKNQTLKSRCSRPVALVYLLTSKSLQGKVLGSNLAHKGIFSFFGDDACAS